MATLSPFHTAARTPALRYCLDRDALLHWFGGTDRISNLCGIYGLPDPCRTHLGGMRLTMDSLAVLLELAERMHRPLDLYQYVRQVR